MALRIRVIVADGSKLMGWLVDSLTPSFVDVWQTASIAEAREILVTDPPDAAIFDIGPSELPWSELRAICDSHQPRIPYLCCSAVEDVSGDGVDPYIVDNRMLVKPIPMIELRQHVLGLVDEAKRLREDTESHEGSSEAGLGVRPLA